MIQMGSVAKRFVKAVGLGIAIPTALAGISFGLYSIPYSTYAGIKGVDVRDAASHYFNAMHINQNADLGHYFKVMHSGARVIPWEPKNLHGKNHAWEGRYPNGSCLLEWQQGDTDIYYVYQKKCLN